jgi:hypothetical protein
MKIREIIMENYTAYVLDDKARNQLLAKFPPKYPKVIAHHVTIQFGVPADTEIPEAKVAVVGYVDSDDGLEALVVAIYGSTERSDGNTYHITWSLDPEKYSPKDSNTVLKSKRFTLVRSIPINTTPQLL